MSGRPNLFGRLRAAPAAVALLLAVGAAVPASAAPSIEVERFQGPDRYSTAAALATPARQAYLVRGDDFADALAASTLSGFYSGGPILLVTKDRLTTPTRRALKSLNIESVNILGGRSAIGSEVEQELIAMEIPSSRISGTDRYDTAAQVSYLCGAEHCAEQAVDGKRTVLITNGSRFGDAVSAGPVAQGARLPVLLVTRDAIPAPTQEVFDEARNPSNPNAPSQPYELAVVLGGPSAVSEAVVQQLAAQGMEVRRVAGTDRTATSVEIAKFAVAELGWVIDHVNLARGDTVPDALAGGPHGGGERAPILLTQDPRTLTEPVRQYLRDNSPTITEIHVFGDATAVSDEVVEAARREAGGV